MPDAAAVLSNVSKKFGDRAVLSDVSLSIPEEQLTVMLGPNGAGKTTTVRIIGGILRQSSGEVEVLGVKSNEKNPRQSSIPWQKIGIQNDGALYETLTVEENLKLWANLYGVRSNVADRNIKDLLEFFSLVESASQPIKNLSKGMRQQVALARALVHQPALLILDEPTSGLDPLIADRFLVYLNELRSRYGMTVLMCTHRLEMIEETADSLIVLNKGKVRASGPLSSLLSSQKSAPVLDVCVEEFTLNPDDDESALVDHCSITTSSRRDGLCWLRCTVDEPQFVPLVIRSLPNQFNVLEIRQLRESVKEFYSRCLGVDDLYAKTEK